MAEQQLNRADVGAFQEVDRERMAPTPHKE